MDVMGVRYAFGYVRVSTDKQDELSPASQEKLLREYAAKNNIIILKIFYEIGVSGRNAGKRPEFQKMIGLAKSPEHPVDLILVWKFSRFARNQEESIVYKSLLRRQSNVDVISVSEPLIDGPFGTLIERIIEWMDEYYSIRLSDEVLRGMKEKATKNGYQLSPTLGYRAVGNGKPFVVDEEEMKIVDFICNEFDYENSDVTKITRKLNDMGFRTRRGNLFESRSVERILKNPFYYGLVVWNGISFMGTHDVRYTQERFEERMKKMQALYKPIKRRDVSSCKHWLSGLLKCGYCGASLSYNGANRHSPGFQCYRYSKGIHSESCSISEKKVIAAIEEYFEKLLSGMNFEYSYRAPETGEKIPKRKSLEAELDRIATREERIRLAFENEVDTLEEYKQNKERLRKVRDDILNQINNLDEDDENVTSKEDVLKNVKTVYDVIKNDEIDYDTKGSFMRSLVEDIVYDKKSGKLIFHLYTS
ncbi:recombinase family protein [Mediterraneibacter gnavus]|nr:recombinase family protein [Mediterraneibacter gnavus]DAH92422.1 MAG TPA: integrase [Caudoviricetes sp.]